MGCSTMLILVADWAILKLQIRDEMWTNQRRRKGVEVESGEDRARKVERFVTSSFLRELWIIRLMSMFYATVLSNAESLQLPCINYILIVVIFVPRFAEGSVFRLFDFIARH
jgi:hypothetical protein